MVLLHFTVLERIVQDSLAAVSAVSTADVRASPIVAGGMATQIHCSDSPELLRPTSDLDLAYFPSIVSYQDFVEGIGGELKTQLLPNYQIQLKRGRGKYEVKVMDGQGEQAKKLFFIHFGNLPPELRQQHNSVIDREVSNAINVNEASDRNPLYVLRIEDIIPRKMKRLQKNFSPPATVDPIHGTLYQLAEKGDWDSLARISLQEWSDNLTRMQLAFPVDQKTFPVGYTINKDLYDLCLLARKIESDPACFNRAYFLASMSEILRN